MMDVYCADEAKGRVGKTENGSSVAFGHVYAQHRRSKSASDRNFSFSRGGISYSIQDLHESPEFTPSERSCRGRSPLNRYPFNSNSDAVSTHRTSLENDIELLQLRLQQEKSMRMLLERAMGRASSTLSPGHRHFAAQTKELIAEIELLEEEVANREQHVLSMYRNMFEQCVSRPLSEQNSVMTSPAHTKNESRKHPSIISSAFCSSKNFPLRTFRALTTINDSGKRKSLSQSKTRHATLFSSKANIHFEKTCSDHVKVQQQLSTVEKRPVLRTLKDHLHQCPSKLSEEMVRCMAAVYCWLQSSASAKQEKNQSPLTSRSSTRVTQCGIQEEKERSSMVEISCISTDKNNFSHASYAISNYRVLVEQLERVNASQMESDAQIAFWINVYNSLVMHAYLAYGIPSSSLRRLALFHKAAYNIGGHVISANAIEQSIFRLRTPRVGWWLETILSTAMRKKSGEERQQINSKFGLQNSQPLVCFALCTGASSDPMLKVYSASNIKQELEVAKREFLQANVVVKKLRKVFLPRILERYAKEASIASDNLLKWVAENVDRKLPDSIQKCIDHKSSKKTSQIMEFLPYNSKFRYVLSKELTEKPWWM